MNEELNVKPFDYIRRSDPGHVLNIIQQEHPQTIAVILSYLEPAKASILLQNLPHGIQSDVFRRISTMDRANPDALKAVERTLEKKLSALSNDDYIAGGINAAVEIINLVDRSTERQIIESLEGDDPELAEEIKKRMFIFEDIVLLDDRSLQKVMREVDSIELAKGLKAVDSEVQDKFFRNMSKRAVCMLKEDMEYMGPIRLKDVEDAQEKIVSIVRHLEDTGEIVIARAGEDEIIIEEAGEEIKKTDFLWGNIMFLSDDYIKKLISAIDRTTLAKALKVSNHKIYRKLTEYMGFFDRQKLKHTIKKLNDLNIDDVIEAQNKIILMITEPSLSLEIEDDGMEVSRD